MTDNAPARQLGTDTLGSFKYLDATVRPSLYRNGEVLTRRDPDGSDAGTQGVVLTPKAMVVHDARQLAAAARCTLEKNGFEVLHQPLSGSTVDFFDHAQVINQYYADCVRVVEKFTGARAFAFDHNIRSAAGKQRQQRIRGGQQVQGPAHVVHGDYTLVSAPARLQDLTRPPSGNDTLLGVLPAGASLISSALAARACGPGGRFALINVWRNIAAEPVATHPLALCDGQSVVPEDLVVFEIHYPDRIGENYFARYSPQHRWYYYPQMTGEEALLIKQWDSAGALAKSGGVQGDASAPGGPCTFSFHSAFVDPTTALDAPDRWSIEVRCLVLYR
jgi:hypothetical protein